MNINQNGRILHTRVLTGRRDVIKDIRDAREFGPDFGGEIDNNMSDAEFIDAARNIALELINQANDCLTNGLHPGGAEGKRADMDYARSATMWAARILESLAELHEDIEYYGKKVAQ